MTGASSDRGSASRAAAGNPIARPTPSSAGFVADTATALHKGGRPVTVFLVQNGVLATRAAARGSHVRRLAEAGVTVLADDFSLRERGIEASELSAGVRPASIEALVDLVVQPDTKTLWH